MGKSDPWVIKSVANDFGHAVVNKINSECFYVNTYMDAMRLRDKLNSMEDSSPDVWSYSEYLQIQGINYGHVTIHNTTGVYFLSQSKSDGQRLTDYLNQLEVQINAQYEVQN